MGYYGRRYTSWRSRGWRGSSEPSKYAVLSVLFGKAVWEIRQAFLTLDPEALNELLSDYGEIYGDAAEKYARKTFPRWKSQTTNLSGQTMERLIELVPPYLSPPQRFLILQSVLKTHKKKGVVRTVQVDVKEPAQGFLELQEVLASMTHENLLAHLPEQVMKAASWLYDHDITAARAMLADAERRENDLIVASARKEIELLRRTISSGQVKAATYAVEMPAGKLNVVAFTKSKCFIAMTCFGDNSPETTALRNWRDEFLIHSGWGRQLIIWYYMNGEKMAEVISRHRILKAFMKGSIGIFVRILSCKLIGE
jgi:hypothetical protein